MPTSRLILFSIVMLCLTVLIAPGLHAYPPTALESPGLSEVAVDRVYLAAGYTDKSEEATIGDPGEQATVGGGEEATTGIWKAGVGTGEQATIGDPGGQATVGDSGEQATIGDLGSRRESGTRLSRPRSGIPANRRPSETQVSRPPLGIPGSRRESATPAKQSALETRVRKTASDRLTGSEECTDYEEGDMKQSVILLLILIIAGPRSAFAATLQKRDSQAYNLQIQESGGLQQRAPGHRKCQVDICLTGAR